MSPRKSSTSSGRPRPLRPRYLGIEVAGEHLPAYPSSRWWEESLRAALRPDALGAAGGLRVVRSEGLRAVVQVDQFRAPALRAALDRGPSSGLRFRSVRTWGTLVGAKAWLRGAGESRAQHNA